MDYIYRDSDISALLSWCGLTMNSYHSEPFATLCPTTRQPDFRAPEFVGYCTEHRVVLFSARPQEGAARLERDQAGAPAKVMVGSRIGSDDAVRHNNAAANGAESLCGGGRAAGNEHTAE